MSVTVTSTGTVVTGGARVVVRTSSGIPYVVVNDGGDIDVYKGNGTTPTSFSSQGTGPSNANYAAGAAAIDSSDVVHISYYNSDGKNSAIRYVTFDTSTDAFSGDAQVGSVADGAPTAPGTAIAVDSNDVPHIAWVGNVKDMGSNYDTIVYANKVGGSWNTAVQVEGAGTNKQCRYPDIAIDADNLPVISYSNTTDIDIGSAIGDANNAASFTLFDVEGSYNGANSSLAVDSSGNHHIVWNDAARINIRKHNYGDAWTTWQTTEDVAGLGDNAASLSLVADGTDLYVFHEDDNNDIYYYYNTGSGWTDGDSVLETGTFQDVRAKWAYWVDRDSSGNDVGEHQTTNTRLEIDYVFSDGTDIEFNSLILQSPPTVALNSPNDTATDVGTTPDLDFTGTDSQSDDVRYNVQVDTVNTFDSQTTTIDSYSDYNTGYGFGDVLSASAVGQSFTGDGNTIGTVQVYLRGSGSSGNVFARIYAHSGTYGTSSVPTGSALASSDAVDASTLGASALISFNFSTPLATSNGTKYVLVIDGGNVVDNNITIEIDSTSPSHDGNFSIFINSSWTSDNSRDAAFFVKTKPAPFIDAVSGTDSGFSGSPDNTDPFTSGQEVTYTVQAGDTLDNSTQYYWRVRGLDPSGSNTYGDWATTRSFTTEAAGGGALSIDVNDSITITEDVTVMPSRQVDVFDSITTTEDSTVLINYLNIDVNDEITVTESSTVSIQGPPALDINVNDSVAVSEDSTVDIKTYINVFDSVTTTENVSVIVVGPPARDIDVNDSISISEDSTTDIQIDIDVNDSVTISENSTVQVNAPVTPEIDVNDSITISEDSTVVTSSAPALEINVNDEITITEDVAISLTSYIDSFDSVTLSEDSTVLIPTLYIDVNDSITTTESVSARLTSYLDVNDEINVTESVSVRLTSYLSVSESITTTENVDVLIETQYINVNEDITLTESSTVDIISYVDVSDESTITEDVSVNLSNLPTLEIDVNESITVTEDVTAIVNAVGAINVSVSESVSITENTPVDIKVTVDESDSITITESVDARLSSFIDTSEDVTVTETSDIRLTSYIDESESITLTESSTVLVNQLYISVSEDITVTEDDTVDVVTYINVEDSVSITEDVSLAISSVPALNIDVNDSITLTEDSTTRLTSYVDISDSVAVSEDTTILIPTLNVSVDDQITVVDSPTVSVGDLPALNIDVFETTTITEPVSVDINELYLFASDSLTITESVSPFINELVPVSSEDITVTEDTTVRFTSYIDGSENITVTDTNTVLVNQLYISVSEDITITENVSVGTLLFLFSNITGVEISG